MQNINVNIVPDSYPQTIRYSQGDVGREFKINVVGFTIPTGATVKIQATKPSGFGFSVAGTVSGSSVSFTTTAVMTDEAGRFPAELEITKDSVVIGTANFIMWGEANPHPEGTTDGQQGTIIPELTLLVERVEAAASSVLDMEVVANTLPAGSQATYSYDEDLNKATFGIPQGEAGAGAAGVVASAYSASATYKVGDYVIHNSNLYRCTTAITTAEAFTAAHWTQIVLANDVSDLKTDLLEVSDTVYIEPTFVRMALDTSNIVEYSGSSAWYIPMRNGYKYKLKACNIADAGRLRIFVTNSIQPGSPYTLLESANYVYYEELNYEYVNNDDYKFLWVQMASTAPTVTIGKFIVEECDNTNDVRVGSKVIHRPNRESVYVVDSEYTMSGGNIVTLSNSSGHIIPCEKNTDYKIIVSGTHNRFYIGGVSGLYLERNSQYTVIYNSQNTETRSNDEEIIVNSGNYGFLVISSRYNIETKPTVKAYKISEPQYSIDGVPLFVLGENKLDMYGEFTSNDDVSLVSTYADLITLYDALVAQYPNYVTKNTLTSGSLTNYEYVFGTKNYNDVDGERNKDTVVSKPVILLLTGVHGDEKSSIMSTYSFLKSLCENKPYISQILQKCIIRVLPCVTPWGFNNDKRWNENGVNINRNFNADWVAQGEAFDYDYSGSSACSEDETKIAQGWIDDYIDDALLLIDFHNSGYENEVSYIGATNTLIGASDFKDGFREKIDDISGYWIASRKMISDTLIFEYTGQLNVAGSAQRYGTNKNKLSATLETSLNQNNSGLHSKYTIGVGAEVLYCVLLGAIKNLGTI